MRPAAHLAAAVVAVSALLAACTTPPTRVAPTTVPPERIDAVVSIALDEWLHWGGAVVGPSAGGGSCLRRPDGACSRVDDGCGAEMSAALCPRVDDYWRVLGAGAPRHDCRRTDVCAVRWPPEAGPPLRTPPWSAAFVSAVLHAAGFRAPEFRFSGTHAGYVVAVRDGRASAFELWSIPAVVAPGDIACAVRDDGRGRPLPRRVDELRDREGTTPMHCDIVVAVDADAGQARLVGGNVQQSVAMTRVPLDAGGRLVGEPGGERDWMLLLRPRRAPTAEAAARPDAAGAAF